MNKFIFLTFVSFSKEISADVTLENPNGSDFSFGVKTPNSNEIEENIKKYRIIALSFAPLLRLFFLYLQKRKYNF